MKSLPEVVTDMEDPLAALITVAKASSPTSPFADTVLTDVGHPVPTTR